MRDRSDDPLYCGVDVGASATKLVLLDRDREVRGRSIRRSGVDYAATARACLAEALDEARRRGRPGPAHRVHRLRAAQRRLRRRRPHRDLTATASAATTTFPRAITIIDIGGQDNKIIRLDESGRRVDFKMNRKCAAGTGAFLEEIALRLDVELDELERLASSTERGGAAEQLLHRLRLDRDPLPPPPGEPLAGLVRGAFASVVSRVAEMDPLDGEVVLTGGVVAHNPTIAEIFAEKLGGEVKVPPHPQFTGALGAALTALAQEEKDA